MATDQTSAAALAPKPLRIRRELSPELASNVREEYEALMAALTAAQAVARAAQSAADTLAAVSRDKYRAAMRPVLRQVGIDVGEVIATEGGYGTPTMLVVDVPPPDTLEAPANG